MRAMRFRLLSIGLLAALAGGAATAAQAQTYGLGTYSGKITQVVPKSYAGHISFVVGRGSIGSVSATFGVACQGLGWVRDQDPVPAFTIPIGRAGGSSYAGTIAGRHMGVS